LLTRIMLGKLL